MTSSLAVLLRVSDATPQMLMYLLAYLSRSKLASNLAVDVEVEWYLEMAISTMIDLSLEMTRYLERMTRYHLPVCILKPNSPASAYDVRLHERFVHAINDTRRNSSRIISGA